MIDKNDFATHDMRMVVDKILKVMQDSDDEEDYEPESPIVNSNRKVYTPSTYQTITPTDSPFKTQIRGEIKLSSAGKLCNISPTHRSVQTSTSSNNFETVYNRMLAFQKRHDQELKKMQDKHEEQHRSIHTHTPTLNDKSRQLFRNVSPIHDRYKQEQTSKNKRLNELSKKFEEIKEEKLKKELTFTPSTTTRSSSSIRTAEEYYSYMKNWKQSKEMIGVRERKIKEDKALAGVTFKPELDKNSSNIAKAFPSFEVRLEKGIKNREAKISEKKSISPCSFKPELQTKYKKVELGPVFDRLYPNHIKLLSSFTDRNNKGEI